MFWRLFKGRTTTTKEESTTARAEGSDGVATEALVPTVASLNAFRFEPAGQTQPSVDEKDTAIDVISAASEPSDVAQVVREKSRIRRGVRVADRGVKPILIPSVQETAVRLRAIASTIGHRKPSEASEYWRVYLVLKPNDVDGWFSYGRCLLMSGSPDEAQQAFTRVVEREPQNSLGWAALGYIAEGRQDFDRAASCYGRAVENDQENSEFLNQYLRTLTAQGDEERADQVRRQIETLQRISRTGLC